MEEVKDAKVEDSAKERSEIAAGEKRKEPTEHVAVERDSKRQMKEDMDSTTAQDRAGETTTQTEKESKAEERKETQAHVEDVSIVLLDIEGTLCPISFVKDVLFPYALTALRTHLPTLWSSPTFAPYISAFPDSVTSSAEAFLAHISELTSTDTKIPALKSLQGYLWKTGYEDGSLRCPMFADVSPTLHKWKQDGKDLAIFSSGSVPAQKLCFGYTERMKSDSLPGTGGLANEDKEDVADLNPLLSHYFDTVNGGPKMEAQSYEIIFQEMKKQSGSSTPDLKIGQVLFLSDNVAEVEAAKQSGMQSIVLVRKGNAPLTQAQKEGNVVVESLDQIYL